MAKLEEKIFANTTATQSKLPSLGLNQIVSAEEAIKLRTDNQNLREKVTEIQKNVFNCF